MQNRILKLQSEKSLEPNSPSNQGASSGVWDRRTLQTVWQYPSSILYGCTEEQQLYSVEEVFDRIDNKFINFYGEYGRKIVNTRRTEWNKDDEMNLKML